jgi:hypothetical protein
MMIAISRKSANAGSATTGRGFTVAPDAQTSEPQRTIIVTAGQAESISVVVPGPSVEAVAAETPTNGARTAQASLPSEGSN